MFLILERLALSFWMSNSISLINLIYIYTFCFFLQLFWVLAIQYFKQRRILRSLSRNMCGTSYSYWWLCCGESGLFVVPQGNIPGDPHLGDCGMVGFICGAKCKIQGMPWVYNIHLHPFCPAKSPLLSSLDPEIKTVSRHFAPLVRSKSLSWSSYLSLFLAGAVLRPMGSFGGSSGSLGHRAATEIKHKNEGGDHVLLGQRERKRERKGLCQVILS